MYAPTIRLYSPRTGSIIPYRPAFGQRFYAIFGHGSILGGSLKRSLGMAKLAKRCNHPQILRI